MQVEVNVIWDDFMSIYDLGIECGFEGSDQDGGSEMYVQKWWL